MRRSPYRRKPENQADNADLDRHFAPLKRADYRGTFEATRTWLERAARKRPARQEPLGERVLLYARHHRLRLAFASLLVACTIAACTIPVEQEETLGYTLSGTFRPDSAAKAVMDHVHASRWARDVEWGQLPREATGGDRRSLPEWLTFTIVLSDASGAEAERRKQELETLAGVASVEVLPMKVKVRRRLYQVAVPPALRPPAWRASVRLSASVSAAEVERAIEKHLDPLRAHKIDVKVLPTEDGGQELVVSSPSWRNMHDEGLRHLGRLQRDMQPFVEEDAAMGFVLSGRFLHAEDPVKGSIHEQIQEMDWFKHVVFGVEFGIEDEATGDWFTFEIRRPGASREQAEAWAEELKAIDGIDEVDVRPIGQ